MTDRDLAVRGDSLAHVQTPETTSVDFATDRAEDPVASAHSFASASTAGDELTKDGLDAAGIRGTSLVERE